MISDIWILVIAGILVISNVIVSVLTFTLFKHKKEMEETTDRAYNSILAYESKIAENAQLIQDNASLVMQMTEFMPALETRRKELLEAEEESKRIIHRDLEALDDGADLDQLQVIYRLGNMGKVAYSEHFDKDIKRESGGAVNKPRNE